MVSDGQVIPERAARWLFVAVAVLVAVGLIEAGLWTRYGYSARGLSNRFDLATDTSVPTFFSSAVLTVSALLTLLVARDEARPRDRLLWRLLAVILVGMAIDEVARFHEWLGDATDVAGDGFFYYTWVYFGMALVVGIGAVFLPFVLRQPRRLRTLIIVSAGLFVGGALLMEMVNANLESTAGSESFRYSLQTAFEETMEMVAVVVLVYALLDELRRRQVTWRVEFGRVRGERVLQRMLAVVAVLIGLGVIAYASIILREYSARGFLNRFTMGSDSSVPTFFSSLALATAAVLLVVIGRSETQSRARRSWYLLAAIFLAMAIDEVARFHEWLGDATDVGGDGFFYYTWMYFGIALVVGIGAVFLPFVLRQPRRLRNLIIVSAALFVGGALLMEMVNANLESSVDAETAERWAEFGTDSFRYAMQTTVEELFEMVGVVVFVYALLDELRRRNVAWAVTIGRRTQRPVGTPVSSELGGADAASSR